MAIRLYIMMSIKTADIFHSPIGKLLSFYMLRFKSGCKSKKLFFIKKLKSSFFYFILKVLIHALFNPKSFKSIYAFLLKRRKSRTFF